jgi:glycosyltransferase involved in cell wall biosynthesis
MIDFYQNLKNDLGDFLSEQRKKYPANELLKIDLHCHDYNSDVPDELMGRILNVPETWLKTEQLVNELEKNSCDVITITNHNNARSCYDLINNGYDVLTGAEFSCFVPDYSIGIHVLAYGFTPEQESVLNKLRKNIYQFQEYTCKENIPTIWAHPLYHYASEGVPPFEFFRKLVLLFERFEVINGQRDTWQNMMVKTWLETLDREIINTYAMEFGIDLSRFCRNPYKKVYTGGSDSHIGLFAGLTGSYLHVPDLPERLKTSKPSKLALEAIRDGRIIPFGSVNNSEKLTIGLLDYVFQIALNYKDPGLIRLLLHKGTSRDKILALLASNGFAEVQRHKTTMEFIRLFHNCFMGEVPSFAKKLMVPRIYKPIFRDAIAMAETNRSKKEDIVKIYHESVIQINDKLNTILFSRINNKLKNYMKENRDKNIDINVLFSSFELPVTIRAYIEPEKADTSNLNNIDFGKLFDGLPFPFLASVLILAANYTSARAMYNTRPLLSLFAEKTGNYLHPERVLWLTDTFDDNNGVSMVLRQVLSEIQRRDLPIDMLICNKKVKAEKHLIVLKPGLEFATQVYAHQNIRVPNFLSIHEIFQNGGYDRIICSTEGAMGLAALYLKNAFNVKAHFFIHTDWIMFARKILDIDIHNLNRLRRVLRTYYNSFDSVFVLNTDHQKWMTGQQMGLSKERVHLTRHWVSDNFRHKLSDRKNLFGFKSNEFVLLYSGRLSREKGIFELSSLYYSLITEYPEVRMVIAGAGPDEEELKIRLPKATYLGWVDQEKLSWIYASADMLVLPSKFDTFNCALLEAMTCGLPATAYNSKGPKDLISDGENGFLARTFEEMEEKLSGYIATPSVWKNFRAKCIEKSKIFNKELIMNDLLSNIGISV